MRANQHHWVSNGNNRQLIYTLSPSPQPVSCLLTMHPWPPTHTLPSLACPACPTDKQAFDVALQRFWSERVRAPGERLPSTSIILGGVLVEPWAFWREVWAWGGPDEVTKRKVRDSELGACTAAVMLRRGLALVCGIVLGFVLS